MQTFDSTREFLTTLLGEPRIGVLFILLVTASVSDYRAYKIPNWLTAGGMLFALACNTVFPFSPEHGFAWALGGLAIGFLTMLPFYGLRIMGAGDVKLMAMVGAFLGVSDTVYAVLFSFMAGGVGALGFALANRTLTRMLLNIRNVGQVFMFTVISGLKPQAPVQAGQSVGKLPYGICISIGSMAYVMSRQFGYL